MGKILLIALFSAQTTAQVCSIPIEQNATLITVNTNACEQLCKQMPQIAMVAANGTVIPLSFEVVPPCPKNRHFRIDAVDESGNISFSLLIDRSIGRVVDCNGSPIALIDAREGDYFNPQGDASRYKMKVVDPSHHDIAWVFSASSSRTFFSLQDNNLAEIATATNHLPVKACTSSWGISFADGATVVDAKDPILISLTLMKQLGLTSGAGGFNGAVIAVLAISGTLSGAGIVCSLALSAAALTTVVVLMAKDHLRPPWWRQSSRLN